MSRFRKPAPVAPPPPVMKFRCEYIGETTFEVEATDRREAARLAEDMIRDETFSSFRIEQIGALKEEPRIGPPEWHEALALAERERPFDMVAVDVGTSQWWLTNGHVALRAHGPQPMVKCCELPPGIAAGRSEVGPTARRTTPNGEAIRLGTTAWAQERYLWLVEELFGRCDWYEEENGFSFVAMRDDKPVAIVMHYRVEADRVETFVEESAA